MAHPYHYLSIKDGKIHLSQFKHLFSGLETEFLIDAKLRIGPEGGGRGEVILEYYDREAIIRTGFICDQGWDRVEAEVMCHSLGYETGLPTYGGHFLKKNITT